MAILDTIKKIIPYIKTSAGYVACRLSSQAVEMDDGTVLQDKIESMDTSIGGKAASSHTHPVSQVTGLTRSRALISDSSGHPAASAVTSTELGYLDGATSNIQSQINSLNSNFIYESRVVKMNNQSLYYFSKSGYALVSAINGDWNSVMQQVTGIAKQGDSYIVFLQENCNVSIRFNLLWIKND